MTIITTTRNNNSMLKDTVTIPFIKKKISKKLLLIIGIDIAVYYYYHKKQLELEDAAQLVLGAPKPGQISITNPNPVRRVAKAKPKVVTGHPIVKVTNFKKPLTNPSAVKRPKPTGPLITGNIVKTVGPFLQSQVPSAANIKSNVNQFVDEVTHPGGIVVHLSPELTHGHDPFTDLKKAVSEDFMLAKLRIAGAG